MPAEQTTRDLKIVQYLVEAHGKEKELELALQAHIKMAEKATYKKRLQDHLKETKAQSKAIEKRIKQLGGAPDGLKLPEPVADAAAAANSVANKAVSQIKGVGHALRGTGAAEKQLKNAKTELFNEHEEIANYIAIETLAEALGDKETAKLAKEHRKQEERMAAFLTKVIPQLTKDVVKEEIPAAERRAARNGSSSRSSSSRSRSSSGSSRRSGSAASSSRSSSRSTSKSSGGSSRTKSASSRSSSKSSGGSRAKSSSSSGGAKRSTTKRSSSSSSGRGSTTRKRSSS